ncbi:MAG: type II secretion system protein [Gammaproteobacteria bacterium]|nr:type II secretion system protein [Gammaproteobacteria bacterium]
METRSALGVWRRFAGASLGRRRGGFTLLELIVVLALVGLVAVLAVPNLERLYEGFTRKAEQGRMLNRIAGLGREAMLHGRAYAVYGTGDDGDETGAGRKVAGYEPYDLEIPTGWEVSLDRPLLVRANGVCLGATLTLVHRGVSAARVVLQAPYCRVDADA